jgi:hypothetical protein
VPAGSKLTETLLRLFHHLWRSVESSTAPAASEPADDVVAVPEAARVGGLSVQLDIAVERRRRFFWRLALSAVVRRLRS